MMSGEKSASEIGAASDQRRVDGLAPQQGSPRTNGAATELKRRGLIAGAAALATAVLAKVTASPAAAADGDNLVIGTTNTSSSATVLNRSNPQLTDDALLVRNDNGTAVRGAGGSDGIGVVGSADIGIGVFGSSNAGRGVIGTSNTGVGVGGGSNSLAGVGVNGVCTLGTGVLGVTGSGTAVMGLADGGIGVSGKSSTGTAVLGLSDAGIAVRGAGTVGVMGSSTISVGVYGSSNTNSGVYGISNTGNGVIGITNSGFAAVYGQGMSSVFAGYFLGDVNVTGMLTKGGGGFKIDHPLDPANKYLVHSFVESPDMKNVYDGAVTTDSSGEAVVVLPDYFETVNRDVRYQLTVVGQFAQAIISGKVQQNRFTIKTDKPWIEVCWQVTGIRKDPFAEQHRLVPEQPKSAAHQGKYLHPELYSQPETAGIDYQPPVEPPKAPEPQKATGATQAAGHARITQALIQNTDRGALDGPSRVRRARSIPG